MRMENMNQSQIHFRIADLKDIFTEGKYRRDRWPTDDEAKELYFRIKENKINTAFEVGTANGFTAACMALAGAQVYTFDVLDRAKIYQSKMFEAQVIARRIHFKEIPTPDCFLHMTLPEGKTLFYLNGDHSQTGAMANLENAVKIARPGDRVYLQGVLRERNLSKVWSKFKEKYPGNTHTITTFNGMGIFIP